MKKLAIRKTAGLMALIMTISLLIPVIAYAASGFYKVDYDYTSGTITGEVYVDDAVYDAVYNGNGKIWIKIGKVDQVVYATYVRAENGLYYYTFTVSGDTYKNLSNFNLDLYYSGSSTALATYTLAGAPIIVPPIFGGIGGGVTTPTDGVVKANPDGTVDANALKKALESGSATVEISGEVAKLPASALTEGGVVTVVSPLGSYELPLDELDLEALAEELGVSIDDLWIVVTIAELEGAAKAAAEAAIESAGGEAVSAIVDFKLEAVAGDKSVEINKFSKFVKRTLNLTDEGDNLVAVRIKGNTVNPIPTKVGEEDAAFFSNSNSVYAVIDVAPKSFSDLRNHWGVKDIHTLANKLIVNGTGAGKFEPKRDVTRAEFAAMIVRALGLQASEAANFSDVASSAWYADAVAAAAEYGIVKGDGTGKFRPTDKISRQEMAAMVIRAQELAGVEVVLSNSEVAAVLAGFKDAGQIGSWARAELAAAIESGVVAGTTAHTVSPNATATRAEAAVMIIRLLNNADFI